MPDPESDMNRLYSEKIHHADPYILCTRLKGNPKKHIAVCHKCKWNKKCRAFKLYWQPELPFRSALRG
jgi:hypothetical protein